jgi:hypothetical protein
MTDEPKHQLHEVAPGNILHIPERFDRETRVWLRAGGVLDLSDPFIAEVVKGQAYKLQPHIEGRDPSPLPRCIITAREKFLGTYVPPLTKAQAAKLAAEERSSGVSNEIEKPDVPSRGRKGAASAN